MTAIIKFIKDTKPGHSLDIEYLCGDIEKENRYFITEIYNFDEYFVEDIFLESALYQASLEREKRGWK